MLNFIISLVVIALSLLLGWVVIMALIAYLPYYFAALGIAGLIAWIIGVSR